MSTHTFVAHHAVAAGSLVSSSTNVTRQVTPENIASVDAERGRERLWVGMLRDCGWEC